MFLFKLHSIDTHTTKYTNYFAYSVLIAREPYSLTPVRFLPLSDNIELYVSCFSVHQRGVVIPFTEVITPRITTETSESTLFSLTTEALWNQDIHIYKWDKYINLCLKY